MDADPWESLKKFTAARIAMGRTGTSIPLSHSLAFRLAHAHARDAVYSAMNSEALMDGLQHLKIPVLLLHSQAANRQQYLQRPDLGRMPDDASLRTVQEHAAAHDVSIVIADGLSARAVNTHAVPLLNILIPMLHDAGYSTAPVCLAEQARVAFADHTAYALQSRLSLMLIGERPGLTAADSMGAYLTFQPRPGLTDESRNCVSNIRREGLQYQPAADKLFYLLQEAFRRRLSGVQLKDHMGLLGEGSV